MAEAISKDRSRKSDFLRKGIQGPVFRRLPVDQPHRVSDMSVFQSR